LKPRIAVFLRHPQCSIQCVNGMTRALEGRYSIRLFAPQHLELDTFRQADIIAFPGGIGDSDSFDRFFPNKQPILEYLDRGGRYLGICMGAYWAGRNYLDILDGGDCVQYIKQPYAAIRRSYSTTAKVTWNGEQEDMFFYDGCSILSPRVDVVSRYQNGDVMAAFYKRIGIIGCHPESEESWYSKKYLAPRWHGGRHHQLLVDFVDELMER